MGEIDRYYFWYDEIMDSYHEEKSPDADWVKYTDHAAALAAANARVAELERLVTQAGVCELAAHNTNVASYISEWESRAEQAERERDKWEDHSLELEGRLVDEILLKVQAERERDEARADNAALLEALRQEANNAYCRYVDCMREFLCLGVDRKIKDGRFSRKNLDAHNKAHELLGLHQGIHRILKELSSHPGAALMAELEQLRKRKAVLEYSEGGPLHWHVHDEELSAWLNFATMKEAFECIAKMEAKP